MPTIFNYNDMTLRISKDSCQKDAFTEDEIINMIDNDNTYVGGDKNHCLCHYSNDVVLAEILNPTRLYTIKSHNGACARVGAVAQYLKDEGIDAEWTEFTSFKVDKRECTVHLNYIMDKKTEAVIAHLEINEVGYGNCDVPYKFNVSVNMKEFKRNINPKNVLFVKNTNEEIEMSKRQHMPVVIESKCPECGHEVIKNYTHNYGSGEYLMYPITNKPFKINLYCNECNHEWESPEVMLKVQLIEV